LDDTIDCVDHSLFVVAVVEDGSRIGSEHDYTHADCIRSNVVGIGNSQSKLSFGGEFGGIDGTRLIKDEGNIHLYIATLLRALELIIVVESRSSRQGRNVAEELRLAIGVASSHVLDLAWQGAVNPDKAKSTIDWLVLGVLVALSST